jgi:hypothetical protein
VFLQLSRIGPFGTNWAFLPLENLIGRHHYFQKLTQFSQGNNVLDAPLSNIGGFPSSDTYGSAE